MIRFDIFYYNSKEKRTTELSEQFQISQQKLANDKMVPGKPRRYLENKHPFYSEKN